jgi:hypothetical protein
MAGVRITGRTVALVGAVLGIAVLLLLHQTRSIRKTTSADDRGPAAAYIARSDQAAVHSVWVMTRKTGRVCVEGIVVMAAEEGIRGEVAALVKATDLVSTGIAGQVTTSRPDA